MVTVPSHTKLGAKITSKISQSNTYEGISMSKFKYIISVDEQLNKTLLSLK